MNYINYEKKYKEAFERAKTFYKRWDSIEATNSELVLKEVKEIFPELKESEDEMIRKYTIWHLKHTRTYLDNSINNHVDKAIAWLEKQGEKKPSVESTEHSYITPNPEFFQWIYDRLVHVNNENPNVDYMISLKERIEDMQKYAEWNEKQGEKKPINKIKPKFNVGDWVVHDMSDGRKAIRQIINMTNKSYVLDGEVFNTFYFNDLENDYHLWTIKDAKDGDVLVSINPFIFKGFDDKMHPNNPTAYCGIDTTNSFIISLGKEQWTNHEVYPATKKEVDFLFQKMKEAGYEWNAEKKELKKIEQELSNEYNKHEPSTYEAKKWNEAYEKGYEIGYINGKKEQKPTCWSEEDENMLTRCIGILGKCYMKELPNKVEEELIWLKSIKNKIQPKKELSEEDRERLLRIHQFIWANRKGDTDEIYQQEQDADWLMTLK